MKKYTLLLVLLLLLSLCGCGNSAAASDTPEEPAADAAVSEPAAPEPVTPAPAAPEPVIAEADEAAAPGSSDLPKIGLRYSVRDATKSGATLVFEQYDADAPAGTLTFGDPYVIETQTDGEWQELPTQVEGYFTLLGYPIERGATVTRELLWDGLYGELTAGDYRVKKVIYDEKETGGRDQYTTYAYFSLT